LSRGNIHNRLWEMATGVIVEGVETVKSMSVANGYNYDWNTDKNGVKSPVGMIPITTTKPTIYISFGAESNVDDAGAIGSNQYIDDVELTMEIVVPYEGVNVGTSEVRHKSDLAYSKGLDDVKKRFGRGSIDSDLCGFGVVSLRYVGSDFEENEGGKFTPQKMIVRFNLKYKSLRYL